jgi:hypothetical protein
MESVNLEAEQAGLLEDGWLLLFSQHLISCPKRIFYVIFFFPTPKGNVCGSQTGVSLCIPVVQSSLFWSWPGSYLFHISMWEWKFSGSKEDITKVSLLIKEICVWVLL